MHAEQVETLNIFRRSMAAFLDEHASPQHVARWTAQKCVDRETWRAAGAFGMLGLLVPEAYGGLGGDFRHERVLMEEFAKRGLEGWGVAVHNMIVAPYLIHHGTPAQRERWLPRIVSGETVLAIAMTEPGAGSDLQGMRTRAVRSGDGWIVNGSKVFISNGQSADLVLVCAKTEMDDGKDKISIFLMEGDADGFKRGRNLDKIGRDAQDTSELFFEDVRLPGDAILGGEPGRGFAQLMELLPQERLGIAVMGLGMLERALALTLDYVKEREAFGQPLIDFQNTSFALAEVKTEATIARVFVDHCTELLVQGKLDAATASMAKLWVTEREVDGIHRCLQFFGGYGYMNEYPIAQLYRDARIDTIHGGTSEIMKLLIARTL
jgi:acyl-CoA dehydrogenase